MLPRLQPLLSSKAAPLTVTALAAGTLLGLGGWLWMSAEDTIARRRLRTPSVTVSVTHPGQAPVAARPARKAPPQPAASDPSLVESSTFGALPRIGKKGQKPWQAYAAPASKTKGRRLTVILHGAGLDKAFLESALARLPAPVTFAFLPYGADLDISIARVRAARHEALMLAPMEPKSFPYDDPGGRALMLEYDDTQNQDRLLWAMGRGIGYTGIMPLFGDAFTETPWRIDPVLETVAARGLLFVDASGEKGQAVTSARAEARAVPWLGANSVLLDARDRRTLQRGLEEALKKKRAVVVAPFLPVTVQVLARDLPALGKDGVTLTPVSAVAAASLKK